MKNPITAAAWLLVFVLMSTTAGFAAGIPDTIQKSDDPSAPPAWISEVALKAAMDAKGQPAGSRLESVSHLIHRWPSLAGAFDRYAKSKHFEIAPDGALTSCEPFPLSYYHGAKAKDLEELVAMSSEVVRVRVLGSKPGFLSGDAGELLEIEVLSVLRDTGQEAVPQRGFYLFDHYARMVIDGKALCLGDRQVPEGEYLLFQIWTEYPLDLGLPAYRLDASALVAFDGGFFGSLLDRSVDPKVLVEQLPSLEEFLRAELP